jgi:D-tyrosyl-tRNA(Tyr) deacylase
MKAVVQRVTHASVQVLEGALGAGTSAVRRIDRGLTVLLGVAIGDDRRHADRMVDKLCGIRIFPDDTGKMNLDIRQAGGEFLIVSQFTLLADTRKGRRPSFTGAADPVAGNSLYLYVVERLRGEGFTVATGEFGAHMLVEIANDGPVTIILDTNDFQAGAC